MSGPGQTARLELRRLVRLEPVWSPPPASAQWAHLPILPFAGLSEGSLMGRFSNQDLRREIAALHGAVRGK